MTMSLFHSLWTIVLLVVFIGIVLWAWSGGRKQAFDEAARLPLEGDGPLARDSTMEGDHE